MTVVKRILCPVDFSEPSRTALEHAETMARALSAEIVLAHVVTPAIYPVAFGSLPLAGVGHVEESLFQAAEAGLKSAAAGLVERGLRCSTRVDVGIPARRIVDWVRELGIDLVVMGTHGFTGLGHVLLGSTAERVVRLCSCPVLTVKAGQVHAPGPDAPQRT